VVADGRPTPFAAEFPVDKISDSFHFLLQFAEDDVSQAHVAMESVRLVVRVHQSYRENIMNSEQTGSGSCLPVKPSKVALSSSRDPLKVDSG